MWMARRPDRLAAWSALLLLAACSDSGSSPSPPQGSAAGALEAAALEAGAIDEGGDAVDPVGSYGQSYEGGRDRLCLLPHGRQEGSYHVGLETRIGDDEHCMARGTARQSGDTLVLTVGDGSCLIVARHEGDQIVLPGAVDLACARLCSGRSSLAGIRFARMGVGEDAARRTTAKDGSPLCP